MDYDSEDDRTTLEVATDLILVPIRLLAARRTRRLYLSGVLALLTSSALFVLALAAYALFYYAYVPTAGFSLPVHLQYPGSTTTSQAPHQPGNAPQVIRSTAPHHPASHPHAHAPIPRASLISQQPYNVHLTLCLPTAPENLAAGNFMLDVELRSHPRKAAAASVLGDVASTDTVTVEDILAKEARPAMLTYASPAVRRVRTALMLPAYVLGLARERECLRVGVMERVLFERGWRNVPGVVRVEVRGGGGDAPLRVYGVEVEFEAVLVGLRWVLYRHWMLAGVVFVVGFWGVECVVAFGVWVVLMRVVGSWGDKGVEREDVTRDGGSAGGVPVEVKKEAEGDGPSDELSDTSRTFPTFSRQPSLKFSGKREDRVGTGFSGTMPHAVSEEKEEEDKEREVEADDEDDEEADYVLDDSGLLPNVRGGPSKDDSGLGTSMESSGPGQSMSVALRRRMKGNDK